MIFKNPVFIVSFNLLVAGNSDFFLELGEKCFLELSMIIFEVSIVFKKSAAIVSVIPSIGILFIR